MGSGKTYMGKMLAQQLDYVFVDMDALIEKNITKPFLKFLMKWAKINSGKLSVNVYMK